VPEVVLAPYQEAQEAQVCPVNPCSLVALAPL